MNRLERLENLSAYIDGELTDTEQRWLAAWCENHPEDLEEFDAFAEVVRLVRELPEIEPPAGLCDRIRRALAEVEPVEATREQAIEWLDKYFDDELPEPQRVVVEHFWATDAEFAETAALHLAMLDALAGVEEREPPADLRARIEAKVRALEHAERAPAAGRAQRPRRLAKPARRTITMLAAAAVLVFFVGIGLGRRTGDVPGPIAEGPPAVVVTPDTPGTVLEQPGEAEKIVGVDDGVAPAMADLQPELPIDDGAEPVVEDGMEPEAPVRPTPRTDRPRRRPVDTRKVADRTKREPRTVTPPAPRPAESPSLDRSPETQPPATGTPVPKSTPPSAPAPLPDEGVGRLAGDAELVDRSGHGSVLGGLAEEGNESDGSRGPGDPTRRTDVAPF